MTADVRRRRLLVVASTFPSSAADSTPAFVRDLALHEATRYDTTVLVPCVPGAARSEELRSGDAVVRVQRFRYFPRRWEDLADGAILENLKQRPSRWLQVLPFLVAETFALRRLVRRFDPDVIHAHWIIPQGLVAAVAARGRALLVTTHGGDIYGLRGALSRRLIRTVLRRASAVTTVNGDMRERLVELGARDERASVLPMGADVDGFRAGAQGVAQVPGRILFVGRLVEKKGVAVLFDALRGLDPATYNVHIAGDGPLRSTLEDAAQGLPVSFLGAVHRGELAREFGSASVVVFPSVPAASGDQDGLPVALLEALAVGRPVIASDLPGLRDAVVDGVSGVLFEAGDSTALRAALLRVLQDPAGAARLGAGAAARADDFSVRSIGDRYVALLDSIGPPR